MSSTQGNIPSRNTKPKAYYQGACFPKSRRILLRSAFQKVIDSCEPTIGRFSIVWISKDPDCQGRLGMLVTKKKFRDAVQRNRIKRLIRESFRRIKKDLIEDPWDMVVLVTRVSILREKQQSVMHDLFKVCKKNGILKKKETPVTQ